MRLGRVDAPRVHPVDLGFLIGHHVVGEFEHHRLVGRARLLVQLFDHVDRAFVVSDHQLQELAGIGRQALDIAPLALGIDGVESE